jgi:hypothetical protein
MFTAATSKMKSGRRWIRFSGCNPLQYAAPILLLVAVEASAAIPFSKFETPPVLHARDLAPATLLAGNGFQVDDRVPTDGLTAVFTIRSDVGTFEARGLEMLRIRIAEIPAIKELNETSKTKVFAQSLATNTARPVVAAGQMVLHPVDTVQGLPSGVGRFFGRVGLAGQRIKEAATEPTEHPAGRTGEVASRSGKITRDVFGYEQERRELAKKLKVDPYTTNPVLSKQLDDIALTAFRAHVGVSFTMAALIPGSMAITATRVVSTWVWDTPRGDLIVRNQETLEKLHVPATTIQAFMSNAASPLSVQTTFVEYLSELQGIRGAADAVALASTVQSEDQARFLTDALGLLAHYHRTHARVVQIIAQGTVVGRDGNGAIIVPAPVDYASWTRRVSTFAHRRDLAAAKRSVWLTGQMSPLARQNFEALGWVVTEKESLLDAA